VAIPEITPVEEVIANPGGKWPDETVHEYGATPPLSASGAL